MNKIENTKQLVRETMETIRILMIMLETTDKDILLDRRVIKW